MSFEAHDSAMTPTYVANETHSLASVINSENTIIRVTRFQGKFVQFEYEMGDPLLCVEMVMPVREFQAFCEREGAQVTGAQQYSLPSGSLS